MRNFTIDRSDTRTNKTKRWLGLLTFCMMAFFVQIGFGQTGTIQIGSGTATTQAFGNTVPITNYVYSYCQIIVTAEDYSAGGGAAGEITKLRFYTTSIGTPSVWANNWKVYLGNTEKTEFASNDDWVALVNLQQVYEGAVTPVANNWWEITFTTPFDYTGGNLIVAIDEDTPGWNGLPTFRTFTSSANSALYYRTDTASENPNPAVTPIIPGGGVLGRTATLPQMQFEGTLAPACPAPNTVSDVAITLDTTVTGTITPNGTVSGYLVVRSTDAVLSETPQVGVSYGVGNSLGNGIVVYSGTDTSFSDTTILANTQYYYHTFAYNSNAGTCSINYSVTSISESITTCPGTAIIVGASNVRTNGAIINWTPALYADNTGVTYTVEISTASDFNTLFDSDSGLTEASYTLTGLVANTTYYWRVKALGSSCDSDWAGGSFVAQSNYSPIAVTGFTEDVIADGIGGASNSTTAPVDSTNPAANNAYVSNSFKLNASSTSPTAGLPVNRWLNSPNISGLSFILPDYAGNNSLRLPEQNVPGTLMFTEPLKLTDVYFAFTSGDGSCTVTAEILFDDATSQIVTGIAFTNWDSTPPASAPAIVGNLPRVKRDLTSNSSGTNFKIFQYGLPIDEVNQSKNIIGVRFTKTSTGTISPVANIFAVSGKIIGGCPILGTTSVEDIQANSVELNWTLSNPGAGSIPADVTYTIQLYSDSALTTPIGAPITGITATEYVLTNLNPLTTYYFTVTGNNGECDSTVISGNFTTPPINDNCSGAIPLTVNSGLTCDIVTSGTTLGATQSMAATPCFGNPDDDVWFSFVATADTHYISISNVIAVSGTATDMYFQILSGDCDNTESILCSDPNDNTATGLIPGETYFIRVYSYAITSRQTFNICIKTMPPAPINDDCSGAIALTVNSPDMSCTTVTSGTTAGATQSMAATPCSGNPDDDVWFSFVATNTKHFISISNVVALMGTSTDMYFQVLAGACDSTSSLLCSDPNDNAVSGLTIGETYFIRVWSYGNTSRNSFNICIKTPPPPATNDDCTDAIVLTVNDDLSCGITTLGTTLGATQSMAATPCFGNPDDDVWFSFVATSTTHMVSLLNVVAIEGTSADMYFQVLSGACGNTTSMLCSDPNSASVTGLTVGDTYFVRVWSYAATSRQAFDICVGTPPANDVCSNAFVLVPGNNFTISAVPTTNISTTNNPADPVPSCDEYNFGTNGKDIWYIVEVPASGNITLETRGDGSGSITDTGLQAYSGVCGSLTSLGCNADDGDGNFSLLSLTSLTPGEIILVRTWGYDGAQGTFQIAAYDSSIPLPCPEPANLSFDNISIDSVELTWTGTADSFDIEYGPVGFATGTGNTLEGVSSPYILSNLDDNTEYDLYIKGICALNESGWTGPITFTTLEDTSTPPPVYCTLTAPGNNDATGLTNVTFNTLDNSTGTTGHYFDYSGDASLITYVSAGSSHNLSVRVDTASDDDYSYTVWVRAWIDWNKDGEFDTTTEEYNLGSVTGGNDNLTNLSPSISIPNDASGAYRLRVKAVYGTSAIPHPCNTQNYSEAEDYTIFVGPPPTCITPANLTSTNITFNSAEFSWNAVNNANSYNWFVFEEDANPETDTPIQTGNTTSLSINVTTGLSPLTHYYFYVQTNCGTTDGLSDFTGIPFSTECLPPSITGTTPDTICGIGEATLSATADTGTIAWYDSETGGNKLGEGETFTTPVISETTSYWVSAKIGSGGFGGKLTPNTGATTSTTNNWGIRFTLTEEVTLTSVDVYSTAAGTLDVKITDGSGVELYSTGNISISNGGLTTPNVIPLSFTAPAGNYRILIKSYTGASIIRDNSSVAFPYTSPDGILTATSSEWGGSTTDYYYYFYNIGYSAGCTSPRTEVIATVTDAPDFELSENILEICEGETTAAITVATGAVDYDTFVWEPSTGVNGDETNGWTFNPTETTTYTLTASQSEGAECSIAASLTINVNPVPSDVTINISEDTVCENTVVTLSATGGNLPGQVIIGTGTSLTTTTTDGPTAFNNRRVNARFQTIYTAAELLASGLAAGNINSIAYNITTNGDAVTNNNYTVKIGAISESENTFSNINFYSTTDFTTCYGPSTYTHDASLGWNEIEFTTPYLWDGISNIVIDIYMDGADNLYSSQTYYTPVTNAALSTYNTGTTATTGTLSNNKLNIKINGNVNTGSIIWSPATDLYLDEEATQAYEADSYALVVYYKPSASGINIYTATSSTEIGCSISDSVEITVHSTQTPTGDAEQTLDEGDTLANLEVDGENLVWYSDENLTDEIEDTTPVVDGTTYYVVSETDICQSEVLVITVTVIPADPCEGITVPVPTGDDEQTVNEGTTLAELIVDGENLTWYADAELTENLEDATVIENNTTYYVTQTIGGCTSEALAVTVQVTVERTDFETFAFRFYPNPVGEVLNLTSNREISQIDLFNMLGQKVNIFTNANNTQVNMSGLPTGNYIISVTIEGVTKTFKVVKQ